MEVFCGPEEVTAANEQLKRNYEIRGKLTRNERIPDDELVAWRYGQCYGIICPRNADLQGAVKWPFECPLTIDECNKLGAKAIRIDYLRMHLSSPRLEVDTFMSTFNTPIEPNYHAQHSATVTSGSLSQVERQSANPIEIQGEP